MLAPRITWLFVRTSPDEVNTMPVPAAAPFTYARFVSMSTTPVVSAARDGCAAAMWAPATTRAAAARTRVKVRLTLPVYPDPLRAR